MRNNLKYGLLLIGLIALMGAVRNSSTTFTVDKSKVMFYSDAPIEKITGVSENKLVGSLFLADSGKFNFKFDLRTLKTGIDMRDEHMNENYLETDKYPYAAYEGKITSTFNYEKKTLQRVKSAGKFSLHGVTKDMEILVNMEPLEDGTIKINSVWFLNLSEYKIKIPTPIIGKLSEKIEMKIVDTIFKPIN